MHCQSNSRDACLGNKSTHTDPWRPGLLSSGQTNLEVFEKYCCMVPTTDWSHYNLEGRAWPCLIFFKNLARNWSHCSRPFAFLNFCFPCFPRKCMTKYINNNSSVIEEKYTHKRIKENILAMEGEGGQMKWVWKKHFRAAWGLGDCSEEYFLGEGGKWLGSVHSSELMLNTSQPWHSIPPPGARWQQCDWQLYLI